MQSFVDLNGLQTFKDKLKENFLTGFADTDTQISAATDTATSTTAGLMSAADKSKLDGIDTDSFVEKISGKGLSTNDFTTADKNKLTNIADSAQVNVIESVKVNNSALAISNKAVNIDLANSTVSGAAQLNTSRNFITNLASTIAGSFNGTASVSSGVTGTLPVSSGGTGQTDLNNVTVGGAIHDNAGNVITDTYVTKTDFAETFSRAQGIKRYGYRIKQSESDPYTRVEYLYDAVGMTPAHMVFDTDTATAGTDSDTSYFDYGSWKNIWFVRDNKPCMLKSDGTVDYYLDPNDYSKKEDGTASDIANSDYDGNAMAQIPLCWIKRYTEGDYVYEIVSNVQYDETYKAYAHTDSSGNIKDYFYQAMFSSSGSTSKIRSLSDQTIVGYNWVGATQFNAAAANGSGWGMWSWSQKELLRTLLVLLSKSTDMLGSFCNWTAESRDVISNWTTGHHIKKGQFASNPSTYGKVFHCEDLFGFQGHRLAGAIGYNSNRYVKMTPPYTTATTATPNVSCVSSYTAFPRYYAPNPSYTKTMTCNDYGVFSRTFGASTSTYYCCSSLDLNPTSHRMFVVPANMGLFSQHWCFGTQDSPIAYGVTFSYV